MNSTGYAKLLDSIKTRVRAARLRAAAAVNVEVVLLYWHVGREILKRQDEQGWGTKVVDRLSRDLGREFPDIRGWSPRNLKYMQAFAREWPDESIVQRLLHNLPWGQNIVLLERVKRPKEREWYAREEARLLRSQIVTLDFGVARHGGAETQEAYRQILRFQIGTSNSP